MIMYVLQNKKSKMFYSLNKIWVKEITRARLFKRKVDLFSFFTNNYHNNDKEGLLVFEKGNSFIHKIYSMNDFNIVGVELITTGIQKKVIDEYKTKQLLTEIEK